MHNRQLREIFVKGKAVHTIFDLEIVPHHRAGHVHGARPSQNAGKSEGHKRPKGAKSARANEHGQWLVMNGQMDGLTHGQEFCSYGDAFIMRDNPIEIRIQSPSDVSDRPRGTWQKATSTSQIGGKLPRRNGFAQPVPMFAMGRNIREVIPFDVKVWQLREMAPELY